MVTTTSIVSTISVYRVLIHGLATVSTYQVVPFKFICILVDQFSPLIHLLSGLLVEFLLVTVIALLKFLAHLVNSVIFLFAKHPQRIIVLIQKFALSKLPWQITRVHVNVNFETFCDCIFDILIQLAEVLKECNFVVAICYLLHKH